MKKAKLFLGLGLTLASVFALASCNSKADETKEIESSETAKEPVLTEGLRKLTNEENEVLREKLKSDESKLGDYKSITMLSEYKLEFAEGDNDYETADEFISKTIYDIETGNLSITVNSCYGENAEVDFKLDTVKNNDKYIIVFELTLVNYKMDTTVIDGNKFTTKSATANGSFKGYTECPLSYNSYTPTLYNFYLGLYSFGFEDEGMGTYVNDDETYIYSAWYTNTKKTTKEIKTGNNGLITAWATMHNESHVERDLTKWSENRYRYHNYFYHNDSQLNREISTEGYTYCEFEELVKESELIEQGKLDTILKDGFYTDGMKFCLYYDSIEKYFTLSNASIKEGEIGI